MKHFLILLKFEWLNFKANRSIKLLLALTFILGLYSIYYGSAEIKKQQEVIEALDGITQHNINELSDRYPNGTDAGNIGYYHSTFARNLPDAWAALSLGQRDINPFYIKLRLLNLQSQLYDSEIVNPMKSLAGNFDLSFVLIYFFPLLIIGLSFNILSIEKEQGTLPLLLSQPIKTITIVSAKLFFRFILVVSLAYLLSIIGFYYAEISLDSRILLWFLLITFNCLFWFGVSFFIASLQKASAFNAVSLLGIWLAFTFIIPAGLNVYVNLKQPVPEALALTIKQREEVHGGWDLPKDETMQRFFSYYPEWKNTAKIEDHFGWRWYYAFQHLGDVAVENLRKEYFEGLKNRQKLVNNLNFLSVPVNVQGALNAIAATDLNAHLRFMESAKKHHDALRNFYYPYLYNQVLFYPKDYKKEPRHSFKASPDYITAKNNIYKLIGSVCFIFILGIVIFYNKPLQVK
ncbi:ABC transporter permease [Zunongwangia sp.]|uniref:ABC transporter permease n=1 Tax=Zunongwangia sp. TaxID=1965325 RepID=UPI003AA887A9